MRAKRLITMVLTVLLILGAASLRPVANCATASADRCCDHCDAMLNRAGCDACQTPIWIGGFASAPTFARRHVGYFSGSVELASRDIAPDLPPPRG